MEVEYLKDQPYSADDDNFKATTMEVVSTIQDLVRQNPLYQEHLKHFVNSGAPYTPNPPQALPRRGRRRVHSDERVANRTIGIRGEMSSRRRFATTADFLLRDCS